MKIWRGIFAVLFATAAFAAEKSPPRFRWETGDGVEKRFDTPGGSVFAFSRSADFLMSSARIDRNHRKNCSCDVCRDRYRCYPIRCNLTQGRKWEPRKWVVLQFQMRSFPGAKSPLPLSYFGVLRSSEPELRSDFLFSDTMVKLNGEYSKPLYSFAFIRGDHQQSSSGYSLLLPYQWTNFRIAFLRAGGVVHCFQDTTSDLVVGEEKRPNQELKSFGIVVFDRKLDSIFGNTTSELEISPPQVFTTDDLEEFCAQNPFGPCDYPYGGYPAPTDFRKVMRDRNPDRLYAAALVWSNPESPHFRPDYALKALEKAARQDHALAASRLVEVYDRGLGVPGDPVKAAAAFRKAERLGEAAGWVSHWFSRWDAMGRPWIVAPEFFQEFDRHVSSAKSWVQLNETAKPPGISDEVWAKSRKHPVERKAQTDGAARYLQKKLYFLTPESIHLVALLRGSGNIPPWTVYGSKPWGTARFAQRHLRKDQPDEPRYHLPDGKLPDGPAWKALADLVRYDEQNHRTLNDEARIRLYHELERYCKSDFVPALYLLGRLYQANGEFELNSAYFSGDPSRGRQYLERAATLGSEAARAALSKPKSPVPQDWKRYFRELRQKRLADPEDPYSEWTRISPNQSAHPRILPKSSLR